MAKLLENGTYGCLEEIARAEKIGASFVSRIIRLALLAPDIVEAILAGKQPASLTLKDLMAPFPVEWAGQRVQFGVGGRRFSADLPSGSSRLQFPYRPLVAALQSNDVLSAEMRQRLAPALSGAAHRRYSLGVRR